MTITVLYLIAGVIVTLFMLEATALLLLKFIHLRWRVYYVTRNNQSLSSKCRAFIQKLVAHNGSGDMLSIHPRLGWTLEPGAISADGRVRINNQGARGDNEYPADSGVFTVGVFGDCLSFGDGVANCDTWPAMLERALQNTQVFNFSVVGYGPCQMYLRYLECLRHSARFDVAILAVSTSSVFKPLNTFRPFYAYDHGLMLAKPGFYLQDGKLTMVDNPLPNLQDYQALLANPKEKLARLAKQDYYRQTALKPSIFDKLAAVRLIRMLNALRHRQKAVIRPDGSWLPCSQACQTTLAIIDTFCRQTKSQNTLPIVLILPVVSDWQRLYKNTKRPQNWVVERYLNRNILALDAAQLMWDKQQGKNQQVFSGRHYSAHTNAEIGHYMAEAISRTLAKAWD